MAGGRLSLRLYPQGQPAKSRAARLRRGPAVIHAFSYFCALLSTTSRSSVSKAS